MVGRTLRVGRRSRASGPRPLRTMALWGAGVLVVAAALVTVDRVWLARSATDPSDPAVRVAGAVRSISGSESVRRATYDRDTRSVRVEASSKYYDAGKRVQENREYLATEGRLAAQLALFDNPTITSVAIHLFTRRQLLATVTGKQGDAFAQMKAEYGGPLAGP